MNMLHAANVAAFLQQGDCFINAAPINTRIFNTVWSVFDTTSTRARTQTFIIMVYATGWTPVGDLDLLHFAPNGVGENEMLGSKQTPASALESPSL